MLQASRQEETHFDLGENLRILWKSAWSMKDIIGLFLLYNKQEIIQANFQINYYDSWLREWMYIKFFLLGKNIPWNLKYPCIYFIDFFVLFKYFLPTTTPTTPSDNLQNPAYLTPKVHSAHQPCNLCSCAKGSSFVTRST